MSLVRTNREANSFRKNVAITIATNVFIAGLTVITGTMAARLLHPSGRGELAAIQVFPAFIATLGMLGLWESVVYVSSSRPSDAGRALGSGLAMSLAACPFAMALGYLIIPWVLSAQRPQVITAARWYLLLIPIYSLLFMPLHALRASRSLFAWNVVRFMPVLGWLAVLFIAWTRNHTTPQWIAGAHLVSLSVLIVPTWVIVLRKISGTIRPARQLFGAMLRYGLPSAAGTIPQVLNLRLDQMLMSAMLPPKFLGLYVVAAAWSSAIGPLLSALAQPLLPKVASQKTIAERVEFFARVLRIAIMLSALLTLCIGVTTPLLILRLFGSEYVNAVPCAIVLVVAAAFSGVNYVLQEGLRGLADTPAVFFSEAAGLVSTALSLLILLPKLGIMGAAIASLLGYSTTTLFLLVRLHLGTSVSIPTLLWIRADDIKLAFRSFTPRKATNKPEVLSDVQEVLS
jgi:O-antigen/teichoic acid export membrane protein